MVVVRGVTLLTLWLCSALQEDRQLNLARQPALKKLKMLPTVIIQLKKCAII